MNSFKEKKKERRKEKEYYQKT